jgi:hypothetical protein
MIKWRIEFDTNIKDECPCFTHITMPACNSNDKPCPGLGNSGCPAVAVKKCKWTEREIDGFGITETNCGRGFAPSLHPDIPHYCPYCGREIEICK